MGQPDVWRSCQLVAGRRASAWDSRKDDFAQNEAGQAAEGDGFVREGKQVTHYSSPVWLCLTYPSDSGRIEVPIGVISRAT